VAPERVEAVRQAVAAAAAASRPLALTVEGPGAFPSPRRPRVLWLGVRGDVAPLQALAADLAAGLGATETATFTPHLTIARARSPRGAPSLAPLLARPPPAPIPWRAEALVLFESHLEPGGARHVALLRAPLGPATGPPIPTER